MNTPASASRIIHQQALPQGGSAGGRVPDDGRRRVVRLAAAGVAAGMLAACTREKEQEKPAFRLLDLSDADYGRKLSLTNTASGAKVSLEDFKGKVTLLFFGFTHCPDVCPTTLLKVAEIRTALGDAARDFLGGFVTLDPERDQPELLNNYVSAFDPTFVALRADDVAATKKVAQEFRVFFQKVPNRDGSSYTLDHTTASYIFDRSGTLRLLARYNDTVEDIVHDLKLLLA